MRHQKKGKVLDRKKAARESLLKNLAANLIMCKKIKTTLAKAKTVQPIVEKLITLSKENNLTTRRKLLAYLPEKVVNKLLIEIGPYYKEKKGGYSRILKIGKRLGDRAEIVQIELIS